MSFPDHETGVVFLLRFASRTGSKAVTTPWPYEVLQKSVVTQTRIKTGVSVDYNTCNTYNTTFVESYPEGPNQGENGKPPNL